MCHVTDRGEQRRVDHRGAGAEQDRSERPHAEGGPDRDQRECHRLHCHSGGDEPFAAKTIRQCTGDQLTRAPDGGVERGQRPDLPD